jgi:hypothetical protein
MKQPSPLARFFARRFPALFLLFMILPFSVLAQSSDEPARYILGNINLSLDTDVLEDGSQIDFSLGYRYTRSSEGEIRLRYIKESYNDDLAESLMANDERTFEVFLLPFRYYFFNNSTVSFNAAAGLYYDYNALTQHGYFNWDSSLNVQRNDFSMHIAGPLAETGLRLRTSPVDLRLNVGVVPIFYLRRNQSMQIKPLMGSEYFDHSQDTSGSPYFFGELSGVFFKYVSLSLLYEFARINYDVINININNDTQEKKWITPEEELIVQSFKIEASLLLPLSGGLHFQVGYGHSFDFIALNSSRPVDENMHYLIIGTKKVAF